MRAAAEAAQGAASATDGAKSRSHGFFRCFNLGFGWLSQRYGWLASRTVRLAPIMMLVYAGVIAYGLNEFRKAPQGFIPQQDRGYLIVAAQLPPGASLERTDKVMRQATEIALNTPGVLNAINIVGFSGATFTNAPNAGAIFVILDDVRQAREGSGAIGCCYPGRAVRKICRDPGSLPDRRAAAAGAGHRQCRRLPHDGGGPRRARAAGACSRRLAQ